MWNKLSADQKLKKYIANMKLLSFKGRPDQRVNSKVFENLSEVCPHLEQLHLEEVILNTSSFKKLLRLTRISMKDCVATP
jgi:hypothetical protein